MLLDRIRNESLYENVSAIRHALTRMKAECFYRFVFKSFGRHVAIENIWLSHPRFIRVGSNVLIRRGTRLEAVKSHKDRDPEILICDNVNIEQDVHIICHSRVTIGANVSIAPRCAIVDINHPYQDTNAGKIGELIEDSDSFVEIGEGAFLGYGAVILPNVRIGKRAVIGANSVVTSDIPDFAIAAGAPAKVMRIYSHETKSE